MSRDVQLDKGLVRRLANTPQMSAAMVASAKVGLNWAEANSPRSGRPRAPGRDVYAESFEVRPVDVEVAGQRRKGAALVNTTEHAVYVEYVNGAHILARAADIIEKGR